MVKKSELLYIFEMIKNKSKYDNIKIKRAELRLFNIVKEMTLKFVNDQNRSYRGYFQEKEDFLQRTFLNILKNLHNIRIVPDLNRKYFATIENYPFIKGKRCQIVDFNNETDEFTVLYRHRRYQRLKLEHFKHKLLKSGYIINKKIAKKRKIEVDEEIRGKLIKVVYVYDGKVLISCDNKLYKIEPNLLGFQNIHSYLVYIIEDSVKQVLKDKKKYMRGNALELILSGHTKLYLNENNVHESEILADKLGDL